MPTAAGWRPSGTLRVELEVTPVRGEEGAAKPGAEAAARSQHWQLQKPLFPCKHTAGRGADCRPLRAHGG